VHVVIVVDDQGQRGRPPQTQLQLCELRCQLRRLTKSVRSVVVTLPACSLVSPQFYKRPPRACFPGRIIDKALHNNSNTADPGPHHDQGHCIHFSWNQRAFGILGSYNSTPICASHAFTLHNPRNLVRYPWDHDFSAGG
jgi:hypothetical protein